MSLTHLAFLPLLKQLNRQEGILSITLGCAYSHCVQFSCVRMHIRVFESNCSRIRHNDHICLDNFSKSESLKISSAEQHNRAFLRQLKFGRNSLVRRSRKLRPRRTREFLPNFNWRSNGFLCCSAELIFNDSLLKKLSEQQ